MAATHQQQQHQQQQPEDERPMTEEENHMPLHALGAYDPTYIMQRFFAPVAFGDPFVRPEISWTLLRIRAWIEQRDAAAATTATAAAAGSSESGAGPTATRRRRRRRSPTARSCARNRARMAAILRELEPRLP